MLHMAPRTRRREVEVTADGVVLPGILDVPARPVGAVVFAHGSGSGRLSPRNARVGGVLNDAHLATLSFDLLTPAEADDRSNVFDVELLGGRLAGATAWLGADEETAELSVGYLGASTGAGAALWAAASDPSVGAVVSRGGRPDLAGWRLRHVRAPTLLIVGGLDSIVLDLNEQARQHMHCKCELSLVPGATHLFQEPGALTMATRLARDWFLEHLAG